MTVVLPAGRVRSAGQQSCEHTKWGLCSRTVTQAQQSVDEERLRLPVQFIPYCHAWFENYFIECNIKLLDAFDNETLPVFQGFGSLMDQCYLQSFGRLCEWSGASKALNLYLLLRNTSCLRPVRSRNRGTRASERVDLEVCFSGPFEGGWAGSILKCSIIRNFLKINIYLSNHAWQYGMGPSPASLQAW